MNVQAEEEALHSQTASSLPPSMKLLCREYVLCPNALYLWGSSAHIQITLRHSKFLNIAMKIVYPGF